MARTEYDADVVLRVLIIVLLIFGYLLVARIVRGVPRRKR
jgi:hypothetical protein